LNFYETCLNMILFIYKINTSSFYKDRLLYIESREIQYMYNMPSLIDKDLHSICGYYSEHDKKY
jgi:hypothetical protein